MTVLSVFLFLLLALVLTPVIMVFYYVALLLGYVNPADMGVFYSSIRCFKIACNFCFASQFDVKPLEQKSSKSHLDSTLPVYTAVSPCVITLRCRSSIVTLFFRFLKKLIPRKNKFKIESLRSLKIWIVLYFSFIVFTQYFYPKPL